MSAALTSPDVERVDSDVDVLVTFADARLDGSIEATPEAAFRGFPDALPVHGRVTIEAALAD